MNVLFASRHPMTDDQLSDAKRIWGDDVNVVQDAVLFTDMDSVRVIAEKHDAVIAVLPQWLAFKVAANAVTDETFRKVWASESVAVQAAHGAERVFKHVAFHRAGDL